MTTFLILTTLQAAFYFSLCSTSSSVLDAVVVVFRHGDRTPVRPYHNDPYRDRSYWPVDWGMLTNLGKRQHYDLGQYFRRRYADFLPQQYSEKDLYVRSTDVDRTLMSAEADLAGLYPPVKGDIWENGLSWQPIPIHTIPEHSDAVLAAKKPCKKYDRLFKKLMQSDYFRNISRQNHDLYAYLTRYSGDVINDFEHLEYLYSTLQIETWYNFTLPAWTNSVFPHRMESTAALSFATATYTPALARLKTGPFFNELINYFKNRTVTPKGARYYAPKFLIYSAHDTTIANLLNTMGAFDYHCPPYTSTVIFELYKSSEGAYINAFYKNSSEARPIKVRNCEFNCDMNNFETIMSPIAITLNDWESECNASSIFLLDSINLYILGSALLLAISAIGFLLVLARYRARKSDMNSYSQLPNEEYA